MKILKPYRCIWVLASSLLLIIANPSGATDVVKAYIGESTQDRRNVFKRKILKQALENTKDDYAEYQIEYHSYYMNPKRGFYELLTGETVNAYFALTLDRWEEMAIPIKIPVRRGLVSYRLLLVNKKNLGIFKGVRSAEQLKQLRAGLNDGWTTYEIMNSQGFEIVKLNDFEGMFNMLQVNRYDYLLRGVNEVFGELEMRKERNPSLVLEPNLAVYIPSATYIFVSKKAPRIARRLREGLQKMVENGQLEALFNEFYKENLLKAELHKRTIIKLNNPTLPSGVPLKQKEYWFDINDYKQETP